jgi:hypothetical protein
VNILPKPPLNAFEKDDIILDIVRVYSKHDLSPKEADEISKEAAKIHKMGKSAELESKLLYAFSGRVHELLGDLKGKLVDIDAIAS